MSSWSQQTEEIPSCLRGNKINEWNGSALGGATFSKIVTVGPSLMTTFELITEWKGAV